MFVLTDPTITLTALSVLFLMMGFMSFTMKMLSPSLCLFLGGLTMFYPDELHESVMVTVKSWYVFAVLTVTGKVPELSEGDEDSHAAAATKVC